MWTQKQNRDATILEWTTSFLNLFQKIIYSKPCHFLKLFEHILLIIINHFTLIYLWETKNQKSQNIKRKDQDQNLHLNHIVKTKKRLKNHQRKKKKREKETHLLPLHRAVAHLRIKNKLILIIYLKHQDWRDLSFLEV